MRISVIIPTYRPEGYLRECLESLDRQTLDRSEYEVLVVLNGDREPYYREIQDGLQGCSFHCELLYAPAAGVSNARNVGLDHARGEYVCFIDDDDYISPAYLEGLHRAAAGHPGAIAASNVVTFIRRDDRTFGKDYIGLAFERFSKQPTASLFKKRKFLSSSCCKLIPKEVIGDRRFNSAFRIGEDALFMFEISDNISDITLSSPDVLYYRRLRSGSASQHTYPILFRLSNKMRLIMAYIRVWTLHITQYNILLFISRIVATIKTY